MIKRLSVAIPILVLSLILTVPVLAAYYIDIDVTESNGTDYDMLAISASMDIDYLAENGFITEDGLDVRVENSQGSELPFMLVADKLMFASAIESDKTTGLQMTTGNSLLDSFAVCVGDGGYVTISDSANLELANDFEVEVDGYIDTSSPSYPVVEATATSSEDSQQTSHTVTLPSGLESGDLLIIMFSIYDPQAGSPTVTQPDGWTELDEASPNTQVTFEVCYKVSNGGEGSSATITTVGDSGYSAHMAYRISNYQGTPEISADATAVFDANPDAASLSPSWGDDADTLWLTCAGWGLASLKTVSSYPTNYDNGFEKDSSAGYASVASARRELYAITEDAGSFTLTGAPSWGAYEVAIEGYRPIVGKAGAWETYVSDTDEISSIIYDTTILSVTATGFSPDEYAVKAWADSTDFGIDIDDSTEDSSALGGVSVPDNANDWYLAPNAYWNYYTHTTSDTLRITYQPDSIISGTTLPNETSPGTCDGTITWGSNPAGISIEISGLELEESYYYTGGESGTTDIFEPEPAELAPGLDSDKLDKNPLKPGVEGFAEASNGAFTESLVWYGIAWFSVIAVGIVLIILVREHLVFAASVAFGLSIFWYVNGVFDYWVLIVLGILLGASLIHEKQPTW